YREIICWLLYVTTGNVNRDCIGFSSRRSELAALLRQLDIAIRRADIPCNRYIAVVNNCYRGWFTRAISIGDNGQRVRRNDHVERFILHCKRDRKNELILASGEYDI